MTQLSCIGNTTENRLTRLFRPIVMVVVLGTACLTGGCQPSVDAVNRRPFAIESVMKSDLHMLVEVHQRQTLVYLQELTEKLYRRNPRQLHKTPGATIESRVAELFSPPLDGSSEPSHVSSSTGAAPAVNLLRQTFDESYQGDRVLTLMSGLHKMVMSAYNHQRDFYYLDTPLDPQKFHNSARNLEIVLWRLSHETQSDGRPWLLSNALGPEVNISYERLFGKLISQLDMMALMVAQQRNIQVKNLMRSVASAVFLPV